MTAAEKAIQMGPTPLFSVIVPTYNRVDLLKETLTSVLAQRLADFELIVVDDGSTDATVEYLASLQGRIKIARQENRGPAAARNVGAGLAAGEYLAFLDSDDVWFPWSLEVYQWVIERRGRPLFIAGKPFRFENTVELEAAVGGEIIGGLFADYLASGDEWRWWGTSSFVIHRSAFLSVGGFEDEWANGEDADLALRLGAAPGFFQIEQPVTFGYREHAASAVSDLRRTLAGAWLQIGAERSGRYPGGQRRRRERRRILTRHVRPVTLSCLRRGLQRDAWGLYLSTFTSNAAQGRLRYLAAFPFIALAHKLLPRKHHQPGR